MLQNIVDDLIVLAEELYGDKNTKFPVTISETKEGHMYPHIEIINDIIKICITDKSYDQLSEGNFVNAINQIAHEVIHVLMQPQEQGKSNYLEEGIAVYFSIQVLLVYGLINQDEINNIVENFKEHNFKYYQAFMLINESKINEEIKDLRKKEPFLAKIKFEDLSHLIVQENIKNLLITNFQQKIVF